MPRPFKIIFKDLCFRIHFLKNGVVTKRSNLTPYEISDVFWVLFKGVNFFFLGGGICLAQTAALKTLKECLREEVFNPSSDKIEITLLKLNVSFQERNDWYNGPFPPDEQVKVSEHFLSQAITGVYVKLRMVCLPTSAISNPTLSVKLRGSLRHFYSLLATSAM